MGYYSFKELYDKKITDPSVFKSPIECDRHERQRIIDFVFDSANNYVNYGYCRDNAACFAALLSSKDFFSDVIKLSMSIEMTESAQRLLWMDENPTFPEVYSKILAILFRIKDPSVLSLVYDDLVEEFLVASIHEI